MKKLYVKPDSSLAALDLEYLILQESYEMGVTGQDYEEPIYVEPDDIF